MSNLEWRTILLIIIIYTAWFALCRYYTWLPNGFNFTLLSLVIAWHSSLQHELLHGHPTPWQWLNDTLAFAPLGLWVPYSQYKQSHLRHHNRQNITHPARDPESQYMFARRWQNLPAWQQKLAQANNYLSVRLLLGPLWSNTHFIYHCVRQSNSLRLKLSLLLHGCLAIALLLVVSQWFNPLWYIGAAYIANSVLLLRAYYEHRYAHDPDQRSVIIESNWFWRLLFLNNNYHAIHHAHPRAAWYLLPKLYKRHASDILQKNGNFHFQGYWQLAKTYGLRSKEPPVYPAED